MREKIALRLLLVSILALGAGRVAPHASAVAAETVSTPNFFDQRQRMTKPQLNGRQRIRFLTTTDFPPFNFLDPRGRLAGFHVDLVRAICDELGVLSRCQIEAMAFKDLVPALKRGDGDAIVVGLAMTPTTRQELAFTEPYFRYPARFVTRKDRKLPEPVAEATAGKSIGVEEGSAHAAMLGAFFPAAERRSFATRAEGLAAMKKGEVDAFFGDGVGLSYWLESETAADCCVFSGGPYLSDRFLGEGLAIAVAPNDRALARSIDYAIGQIVEKKHFSELLLRYFPVSAF
ncbi:MAG TPA: transporter substrate-binding domain-containing protein [Aurantimonas sp.]|uniref:Transporter substrate-binding domain-containing protein n=1 Tax=Aurantimonas marianensis TaxID=2920428 RepID=A0A9X2HGC4_9HYPH|nr:transporter substrate-binding domain-containing protein [Aurantimonas marianensis]MCP3056504.1 transporter substrate-binding domain-containing protein [Aurantimonas marianensis]